MPIDFEEESAIAFEEEPAAAAKDKTFDDYATDGASLMRQTGRYVADKVGHGLQYVDSVTGAPVRSAVGALQDGKGPVDAYGSQFAEDPAKAPSGKDIATKLGLSPDSSIDTGLIMNPFEKGVEGRTLKLSPAGIAGAGIDVVTDPTTYVGPGLVKGAASSAAKLGSKSGARLSEYLAKKAAERTVKVATGQSASGLRRIAKTTAQSAGDIQRAESNIQRAGQDILGQKALGWFDRTESLAPKLAEKKRAVGAKLGEIGSAIDTAAPGSVSGDAIAQGLLDYASTIPNTPEGRRIQEAILAKAQQYQGGRFSFEDAKFEKNQYRHKPGDSDILVSNQDIANKVQGVISGEMEKSAANLAATTTDPKLKELLGSYKETKGLYGSLKSTSDAATDRTIKNLSNRMVSPSDYGVGATGAVVGSVAAGGAGLPAMIIGVAAAGANKLARERGSAFAARSLQSLSNAMSTSAEALGKYQGALSRAASEGTRSLVVTHHLLMNNDPEYRRIIEQSQPQETPPPADTHQPMAE